MNIRQHTACAIAALFMFVFAASADAQSGGAVDAKVQAALGEITRKQDLIKELVIDDYTSTETTNGAITFATVGKIMLRPPDFKFHQFKITRGKKVGQITGTALNREEYWKMEIPSPIMLRQMKEQMLPGMGEEGAEKYLESFKKVKYTKLEVPRLREAGVYEKFRYDWFLHPYKKHPAAGWRLINETPAYWIFTTKMSGETGSAHFAFSKENGLCVRADFDQGAVKSTIMMNKVTINPATPIPDSVFEFTPPADADVRNYTQANIEGLRAGTIGGQ